MCGIAGLYQLNGARASGRLAHSMANRLVHRGPDDSGVLADGPIALAHRRLSIIDLSKDGHQPMWNDTGSIAICYNGECYNYVALRRYLEAQGVRFRTKSDTEVVLRLYEHLGEKFLDKLEGMFAIAIWDRNSEKLILARDRLGIKPLYFACYGGRLSFASEMKALLADPSLPREIDNSALGGYLHLLASPGDQAIFKHVSRLRPGHMLVVTKAGLDDREYWRLDSRIDAAMSLKEASDGFVGRFEDAVASHMISDVPVGGFLSGGVDSSAIAAFAANCSPDKVETFSITFPSLDEYNEGPYAEAVAGHCGTHHHSFDLVPTMIEALPKVIWHSDEPFAISSAFALYFIASVARDHVKVVLSGDGADELFAGYVWRHADFPELPGGSLISKAASGFQRLYGVPASVRRKLRRLSSPDGRYIDSFAAFQTSDLLPLLNEEFHGPIATAWLENPVQLALEEAPYTEQLASKLYADVKTTLVSEMLTKVDRMTMAHGLEARVPFLDHKLVEWAFTIPGHLKLQGSEGKLMLKKALEPYLPRDILYRKKQGFNVPMPIWMRGELKDFVRDTLSPERVARRGLFNPKAVNRLLDRHFDEREDASNKIFSLIVLELWHMTFVDSDGQTSINV